MLENILYSLLSIVALLLPIFFWMYLVTQFSHQVVGRKHFLLGMILGGLSVIAFIFHDLYVLGLFLQNFFQSLHDLSRGFDISYMIYLGIFTFVSFSVFLFGRILYQFFSYERAALRLYVGLYYLSLIVFVFFSSFFFIGLGGGTSGDVSSVQFGTVSFSYFGALCVYYFAISYIEEMLKYFGVYSLLGRSIYSGVTASLLLGACVGLGFSFTENMFYAWKHYHASGGIDASLFALVFFRSIFTLSLHIFAAMLMSGAFWYALYSGLKKMKKYVYFFIFAVLSLISHAFFDISMSYNLVFMAFVYVFFLYVFMNVYF